MAKVNLVTLFILLSLSIGFTGLMIGDVLQSEVSWKLWGWAEYSKFGPTLLTSIALLLEYYKRLKIRNNTQQ